MRKVFVPALAAAVGFAASAHAADLGDLVSTKDPLPDTISWHGITLYGTIDVGAAYQSHAAPQSGALYTGGLDTVAFGTKDLVLSNKVFFSGNGLSQSFVGLKTEQELAYGFAFVAKVESGFNPWSAELADACASLQRVNGTTPATQPAAALDGSRCGQFFNGPAYAGLSSKDYGTLTIGRQNSLNNDLLGVYDPLAGSYAFSLLYFSGGSMAGIGTTEDARWDNSFKYVYTHGAFHVAGMYAIGGDDTAIADHAGAINAGFTWKGLSIDADYTKEYGGVNASALSAAQCAPLSPAQCQGLKTLSAFLTNDEAYTVAGKYEWDLGGGYKDLPAVKFTIFGGYNHATLTQYTGTPVSSTIGGYSLILAPGGNEPALGSSRVLQTAWAGAKYETGPWIVTGAYYYLNQNQFISATKGACNGLSGVAAGPSCAGDFNMGSFVVDYVLDKHFDVYAGISYSESSNGLVSGWAGATNTTTVMSGLRVKF